MKGDYHGGARRALDRKEEDRLMAMFLCGFRVRQIAQYFHLAEQTVLIYVRRNGMNADDILPVDKAIELVKEKL